MTATIRPLSGCEQHQNPACLCDVSVDRKVAVNFTPDKVWHGEVIARALGIDFQEIDGPKLADYLEALALGYDTWRAVQQDGPLKLDADLRARIDEALAAGHSMCDLPDLLGVSWQNVCFQLSSGNRQSPMLRWVPEDAMAFEADWLSGRSVSDLGRDYGLSRISIRKMAERLCLPPRTGNTA